MRVLITGGAGFIGSHLVQRLHGRAQVRVLDNLRSGSRMHLEGFQGEFVQGSILDRRALARAMEGVDCVFHLAAFVSVPESVSNPAECTQINSDGTLLVLEEAACAGVKKLVFSTSAAVYGDNPVIPKVETMAPEPKSPYAATKLQGELYCQQFQAEGRLSTVCLRYFNVFGPRQNPRSQYAAAVPIFIERALKNAPLTIYGDGEQTRDFIFVNDIVAANIYFGLESAATGIYNVASGRRTSVNELAHAIRELTHSSSEVVHASERPGDVKHSVAAIEKLHGAGFTMNTELVDGLRTTVAWFENQNTVEPC